MIYSALMGIPANKVASPKQLKVESLQHYPAYVSGLKDKRKEREGKESGAGLPPAVNRGRHRTVLLRESPMPLPRAPGEHSGASVLHSGSLVTRTGASLCSRDNFHSESHSVFSRCY